MADHQPGLDRALAPLVPQVDVQVGAADRRLLELDQDLVRARLRHRDLLHPDALGRFALDQRLHGRGTLRGLAGQWRHGVAWRSGADARLYRTPGRRTLTCPQLGRPSVTEDLCPYW